MKTKWSSVVQELMTTTRQGVKQLSASESRAFPQSKILPCQRAVLLGEPFYSFKLSWHMDINDHHQYAITRNLPWKIMIMQRTTQTTDRNTKSVGYFLQVIKHNR